MVRQLIKNMFFIFHVLISILLFTSFANASGSGITYSGRLIDPNGNAVVSQNVQFKLQIRTPGNENCLMYEEIQSKDMTNSDGIFAITINDGTGSRTDSTGFTLDQLFANRGSFNFPGGYCVIGSTYNTTPTDSRKLQVYFNDGSFATGQWEPTPSMAINFIPMAIEAQQVGGYKKEQILKLADGVTTTGSELDATKWTSLQALINGTSTVYSKPTDQVTQLYGAAIPAPANGQSIRWNTTLNAGSGGWENFTAGTASAVTTVSSANADIAVANGSTTPQLTLNSGTGANQIVKLNGTAQLPAVDGANLTNLSASKIIGTAISIVSLTNGQVLKYNGANWVNTSLTDNDTLGGLSCANGRVAYYTGGSWACLEVTSGNTINTIVSRDGSGVSNFGTVNTGTLKLNDGVSGEISLTTPATVTSYAMRLPTSVGSSGQVLTTDGGSPAQLSWTNASSQWVTSASDIYYNTGKVGIGTAGPTANLEVVQSTSVSTLPNVLSVTGGQSTGGSTNGGGISLTGGIGVQYGGAVTIASGDSNNGGLQGRGSKITLAGGFGGGGGGDATIEAGNASNGWNGGNINLKAGNYPASGSGGIIQILGGAYSPGNGGNILINGGVKAGAGVNGNVILANSQGNVGIGTASPQTKLHIQSASATTSLRLSAGTGVLGTGNSIDFYSYGDSYSNGGKFQSRIESIVQTNGLHGAEHLLFHVKNSASDTAPSEKMRIAVGGNVGIGSNNPSRHLHIYGNPGSGIGEGMSIQHSGVGGREFAFLVTDNTNVIGGGKLSIYDSTSAGHRLVFDSAGNVGVGNASPTSLFHVGSSSVGTGIAVANFQNVDGTCTITPASSGSGIACSSDERLKENFQDVTGTFALDRILRLQAVTYNFKTSSDGNRRTGYKAQEVQKIAPEFVRENEEGFLQVYYDAFIPWITESIKILYSRIKEVEIHQVIQNREIASMKSESNLKSAKLEADIVAKDKRINQLEQENAIIKARLEKIEKTINFK